MKDKRKTILFLSHDTSRTGGAIFLLRFLRWLREKTELHFRVLAGSRGELYPQFEALCSTDSFEPELSFSYKVKRKLGIHNRHKERHLADLRRRLLSADTNL